MKNVKKYSISLIVTAAIIIEVLGAAQYFMARNSATRELLAKAQRDMQESQRVAKVKTEAETALLNAEQSIHLTLGTPETSYSIAARIIKVTITRTREKANSSCLTPTTISPAWC